MLPPRDADHVFLSEYATLPLLEKWQRGNAYDTAKECEAFRALFRNRRTKLLEEVEQRIKDAESRGELKGDLKETLELDFIAKTNYLDWVRKFQCVATDDARLDPREPKAK